MDVQIEASWKELLKEEFDKPYFERLVQSLKQKKANGLLIYPPGTLIFNAYDLTPVDKVKVVILGQDPYHGPGEAMGLCFSVPEDIAIPPSLKNIYKEIEEDLKLDIPRHGNLSSWAKQGVFMLNAILTVEHKSPGSHKNLGWQEFTDATIRKLSENKEDLVFLMWGRFAQTKIPLIDQMKHHVLTAAHPSPLARNAFSGCRHFSKCNLLLDRAGKNPIDWQIN